MLRNLAANSLLDLKVLFHSTAQTHSRLNQHLVAWDQDGFFVVKKMNISQS